MRGPFCFAALALFSVAARAQTPGIHFRDVTASSGIDFRHQPFRGDRSEHFFMPEVMGSGGAFLDYDGDGDLDVYLVQAAVLDESGRPVVDGSRINRLLQQEPNGTFVDVTERSGLGDPGFGMGVAVGDVDNDGRVDVYVTNYGPDALYLNLGDGRFDNRSRASGIRGDRWSSSATFCDYDGDGYLDLYVAHYLDYDSKKPCFKHDGSRDYCGPQEFRGASDTLYHNDGDGTFTDVSGAVGIGRVASPGLGVVCVDLDDDGRQDFYVANDGTANQLWMNRGGGRFDDEAYMTGSALNSFGKEEAGMGIAPGDLDSDLDIDLFLTHLTNETNTLYLNDLGGAGIGFHDATNPWGLGTMGIETTGFGTAAIDFDHDGELDLAVVNGRVAFQPPLDAEDVDPFWRPYAEPNVILRNAGASARPRFERSDVSVGFGERVEVSRGLAAGDVDGDGDVDLLVTNAGGPARLFSNESTPVGRWLIVRTFDPKLKRDAYGSRVTLTVGGRRLLRVATPGYGYLSSNDPRAHFGFSAEGAIGGLEVRWPDGTRESFDGPEANRVVTVRKGDGRLIRPSE